MGWGRVVTITEVVRNRAGQVGVRIVNAAMAGFPDEPYCEKGVRDDSGCCC